ncbi:methyl-accepting chemotaxis protein [Luteibacter sp. UNCMF366Tsu5.1]|uniref:methyl-accepting chemotaxis protein n=1 Tax=Luteibacter sp. UNCMF366Tsu5.1 TaxID=1502758 RepID=UPI0009089906|nr:methyl-accepting chemotaxis protein [Luteibacter sp. UNCMF366Tsu5.1]SFW29447.1 Methyl-accepting chemotaxis protein [Luteibacter sp. UNCMF366Tsu5.1]
MQFIKLASRNKLIFSGFAAIAMVVIVLVGLVYAALQTMERSTRMDLHSNEVLRVEGALLGALVNIETGERGYLITGKEASLAPMIAGQAAYADALSKLRQLTIDNAEQQKRLADIDAVYRSWTTDAIDPVIALQKKQPENSGSSAEALAYEREGKGKARMDEMRDLLGKFVGAETALLDERSAQAATTRARTDGILLGGGLLALLAIVGVATALVRSILAPLEHASAVTARIAAGHLGESVSVTRNDDLGRMLNALHAMDENLARIVGAVRENAVQVEHAARDISAGNDDLSNRTQEQASSLEETAASMEEMSSAVKQNASGAALAQQISQGLRTDAKNGGAVADEAVEAMKQISEASRNIGEIAVLIDEIAFQTNLLALNAAVEAARAGEQGRGFAVVAAEVRNLAQRSAAAAKDIKSLIGTTVQRVSTGSDLVNRTGQALVTIGNSATKVADIVSEISAASQEQSAGVEQVNVAVASLDDVTQQNAALVEEASAASRQALELAQELTRQVAFFKLADSAAVVAGASSKPSPQPVKAAPVSAPREPLMAMAPAAQPALASGQWREF